MRQARAVIFDLDGCLVDSEARSIAALSGELGAMGVPDATFEAIRDRFLGVSMQDICRHVAGRTGIPCPPDFIDRVEDRLFALYRESLHPIPGAARLLAALKSAGIPFAIATGGSVRRMTTTLAISGLAPWFAGRAFSADQVRRGKPAPDLFLLAAERLGVPPGTCTVIEDSPHGIAGARAAGMETIGFTGGSHLAGARRAHGAELRKAGAAAVFRRLADVRAALLAG